MPAEPREGGLAGLADPQADLFFTLVAVVLPAILLLLPAARMAQQPERQSAALADAVLTAGAKLHGADAAVFLARRDGVAFGPAGHHRVGLDAMLDDAGLKAALGSVRAAGKPLLLLIEPDGQEAAFLFDGLAAMHGPRSIAQVRLDRGCASVRGPLSEMCF
jgi:hypothetical protein